MKPNSSRRERTLARDIRVRIRSDLQLAVISAIVFCCIRVFTRFSGLWCIILSGALMLSGLIGWFRLRKLRNAPNEPIDVHGVETKQSNPSVREFKSVSNDGEIRLECEIQRESRAVKISLLNNPNSFKDAESIAMNIATEFDSFEKRLLAFVETQIPEFEFYRDELLELRLKTIEFANKKDPAVAEVIFDENESGRIWGCVYKSNKFLGLGFDA